MSSDPSDQIQAILDEGRDVLSRIASVLGMDEAEKERDELRQAVESWQQRCNEMSDHNRALQVDGAKLRSQLAECYRLSGADPDDNEDWRLAGHAVAEVRRLREYCDELETANEWQSMDTAPKDDKPVLLLDEDRRYDGSPCVFLAIWDGRVYKAWVYGGGITYQHRLDPDLYTFVGWMRPWAQEGDHD